MMRIWNRAYLPMVSWTLSFVNRPTPRNILDIGVGNGASTNYLHQHFPTSQIYGIDFSKTAILEASKHHSGSATFEEMSINKTDYPSDFFDLIFAFQTHFHWEQLDQALMEIERILVPSGECWIACEHSKVKYYLPDFAEVDKFQIYLANLGLDLVASHQTKNWICYQIMKLSS